MTKMSINFDNEEQYKKFIQSIKEEVLKEVSVPPNRPRYPMAHIWNHAKDKIAELGLTSQEEYKMRSALSTILQYGLKTTSVHMFPDERAGEVKPLIDEIFGTMEKIRKHKRTEPPYENYWRTRDTSQ